MPQAWIARFGRTVTGHVLDAVEARLAALRTPGASATLAGQALPAWTPDRGPGQAPGTGAETAAADPGSQSGAGDNASGGTFGAAAGDRDAMGALGTWLSREGSDGTPGSGAWGDESRLGMQSRTVAQRDLLTGTSFALTAGAGGPGGPGGGLAGLWGRGAITRFDGRDGDLSVDGEVSTGLVGADFASNPDGSGAGRWTAGLALGHSRGTGGWREGGTCATDGNCSGKVEATLTGLYPYAGLALTERLSVWAAAGHGAGELTLKPDKGKAMKTDLAMTMGAAGLRSEVLRPPADGGRPRVGRQGRRALHAHGLGRGGRHGGGDGGRVAAAHRHRGLAALRAGR